MAEMSDFKRAKVGCVAVIGKKVVAAGFSQNRTHPMQEHFNIYRDFCGQKNIESKTHSEIHMLAAARHMNICWSKADVYIYRICSSRQHGIALPCDACMKALREFGIKNVYYTTDTGYDYIKIN